jgi:hypothetical protein
VSARSSASRRSPATAARDPAAGEGSGWQGSATELVIAAVLVIAVTGAVWAWAGLTTAAVTLTCFGIVALIWIRTLAASGIVFSPPPEEWHEPGRTTFTGFWRKRGTVKDATASMASYELELRPTLQNLLAARLAERHGVSLYQDPDAARRLLLPSARDSGLWRWLDPERPAVPDQNRSGIPPRTLAAIIDRLERL